MTPVFTPRLRGSIKYYYYPLQYRDQSAKQRRDMFGNRGLSESRHGDVLGICCGSPGVQLTTPRTWTTPAQTDGRGVRGGGEEGVGEVQGR